MSTETNVAKQEREKLKLEIQRQKEKLLKVIEIIHNYSYYVVW
jgi:hypothetical protein